MTTIYDDCSKEELLQIVSEMQKDLNDSKKENKELKFRIKMLIKVHLNSIYGLYNVLDSEDK